MCFRIIWILIALTATTFCSMTTYDTYVKYQNAPIMMKHEDQGQSGETIPFPAITFVNELQFRREFEKIMEMFLYYPATYNGIMHYAKDERFVIFFKILAFVSFTDDISMKVFHSWCFVSRRISVEEQKVGAL